MSRILYVIWRKVVQFVVLCPCSSTALNLLVSLHPTFGVQKLPLAWSLLIWQRRFFWCMHVTNLDSIHMKCSVGINSYLD